MKKEDFFSEATEQSKIKSKIVAKYFDAWSKIMIKKSTQQLIYFDIFCGPGRYDDGTPSTPLLIIEKVIANKELQKRLQIYFNDENKNYIATLKQELEKIENLNLLKFTPYFSEATVGEDIEELLAKRKKLPTLSFIDPTGYKGLSLSLFRSVIEDWGCDSIFFFNYRRINMAITNNRVFNLLVQIFGYKRANRLREIIGNLEPNDREKEIIKELESSLKEIGGRYVCSSCFKEKNKNRTSHYIVFVSKNVLGYDIMKSIMAKHSSTHFQEVPSFVVDTKPEQISLFPETPLNDLESELTCLFKGQSITIEEIFRKHNIGTNYIKQNYKTAIKNLNRLRKVKIKFINQLKGKKKITYKDIVIFPE